MTNIKTIGLGVIFSIGAVIAISWVYISANTIAIAPNADCEMASIVDNPSFHVKACGTLLQQRGH